MSLPDMIKIAADAQPELVERTAALLSLIEAYDPSFLPDVLNDFETITEVVQEKVASEAGSEVGKGAKKYLAAMGLAAVGAVGSAVAGDMWDAAKRGWSKAGNYKRIMQHNPDLQKQDQKALRAAYDSLHRYAPEFTADPLVGGAILKNLSEYPLQSQKTIFDVLAAKKNLADARNKQFNPAAQAAIAAMGAKDHGDKERSRSSGDKNPGRMKDNLTND